MILQRLRDTIYFKTFFNRQVQNAGCRLEFCRLGILQVGDFAGWGFCRLEFCRLGILQVGILQVGNFAGWGFCRLEFCRLGILQVGDFAGWGFCRLPGTLQVDDANLKLHHFLVL